MRAGASAVGIRLIEGHDEFVKHKPGIYEELLDRIRPDNQLLNLLPYVAAENLRKRDFLSLSSWCKVNLEVSVPVIRTSIGSDHPDRALYSTAKQGGMR